MSEFDRFSQFVNRLSHELQGGPCVPRVSTLLAIDGEGRSLTEVAADVARRCGTKFKICGRRVIFYKRA
jgi:hypothetical protein